jgi:hypothetical protein
MLPFDLTDLPMHRDDPFMGGAYGWSHTPPAIVQPVEGLWSRPDLEEAYRCDLEISLEEVDGEIHVERYVAENGSVVAVDPQADESPADPNSLPVKLDTIKTRLGIGMKHLAAAMGVERPTVYAWAKGERLPQPKRWDRIQLLLELADHWQELSRQPLSRRIFVPVDDGQSAMDLMSAESLDTAKIKQVLTSLAADENARSARLRSKAAAMRERMKARGAKPLPAEVVEQTMRNLSRS